MNPAKLLSKDEVEEDRVEKTRKSKQASHYPLVDSGKSCVPETLGYEDERKQVRYEVASQRDEVAVSEIVWRVR